MRDLYLVLSSSSSSPEMWRDLELSFILALLYLQYLAKPTLLWNILRSWKLDLWTLETYHTVFSNKEEHFFSHKIRKKMNRSTALLMLILRICGAKAMLCLLLFQFMLFLTLDSILLSGWMVAKCKVLVLYLSLHRWEQKGLRD